MRSAARWVPLLAVVLGLTIAPRVTRGQSLPPYVPLRPHAAWRTLETPHFVAHFPAELEGWTRAAIGRIEDQRDAVRRLVGWAPRGRVTVLVADPYNDANGSAYPFLREPAVFLWPVPASPRDQTGDARWAELLTVHEFAHVAHLARPTRNPLRRTLASLLPTNVGPIGPHTPRWVWEGYATYVEGALTGRGRPYGVWRPAFLRQWAIEGRLPTYAAVSGGGGFAAGSFAYLAGSAYFEWLVAQRGDSSAPALWRRMTARTTRSFDAAFAGVFPGTPAELYARWSGQVTAEAVAAERALRDAGLVEGALVQRLRGATGDPAVSRDGERVALEVREPGRASRIVIWRTGPEPRDSARDAAAARARDRQRRLDPEDVAAVPYLPPSKRALATLTARDGRSFRAPRWFADARRLLVERDEPLADGTLRPDLWTWDSERDALRRVTRGAAVRDADPSPDGRSAIATRCVRGWCDLVAVDLVTGVVRTLVAGSTDRTFARPRWSHDGRRFAVAEQRTGRWTVTVGSIDAPGERHAIAPEDGASRYEPAFAAGSDALFVTSEASGVPNVERIDLTTRRVTTWSRVTGAAFAPEPIGTTGDLYALTLRSSGFDLRRFARGDSTRPAQSAALAPTTRVATGAGAEAAANAVARRPPARTDTFTLALLAPSTSYGFGRRAASLVPAGAYSADGHTVAGAFTTSDPIGRLTTVLTGAAGEPATWRGGALSAALRVLPTTIEGQLFGAAQRIGTSRFAARGASGERAMALGAPSAPTATPPVERADLRYHGALLALAHRSIAAPFTLTGRIGASAGRLELRDGDARGARTRSTRTIAFADVGGGIVRGRRDRTATLSVRATQSVGSSDGDRFRRWLVAGDVSLAGSRGGVHGAYARGMLRGGARVERFAVGGPESGLLDAALLGQRLPMPALPTGTIAGRGVEMARVDVTGFVLSPYLWSARSVAPAPDRASPWLAVVGAQRTWTTGSVPFARAPGIRATAGVGYALDGPTRRRAQLYVAVAARP